MTITQAKALRVGQRVHTVSPTGRMARQGEIILHHTAGVLVSFGADDAHFYSWRHVFRLHILAT